MAIKPNNDHGDEIPPDYGALHLIFVVVFLEVLDASYENVYMLVASLIFMLICMYWKQCFGCWSGFPFLFLLGIYAWYTTVIPKTISQC